MSPAIEDDPGMPLYLSRWPFREPPPMPEREGVGRARARRHPQLAPVPPGAREVAEGGVAVQFGEDVGVERLPVQGQRYRVPLDPRFNRTCWY